jgi:ubiquinone/menaquinone biosynthesis C-methylase UbiE
MQDEVTQKNAAAYDAHADAWEAAMATNVGHKYVEKPAMKRLLPNDLNDKVVLCVGVGSGDELADIVVQNPARVVGIDVSEKLIAIAKTKYPTVEFKVVDMMSTSFADDEFDFVYSSLTFHYANDWDALLAEMKRVLKQGGMLLFSTHNPNYWGKKPTTGAVHTNKRGIILTEHTATLPGDIEVTYYNHPDKDSILGALQHAGFTVIESVEPPILPLAETTSPEERDLYLKLESKNQESPLFFVALAQSN